MIIAHHIMQNTLPLVALVIFSLSVSTFHGGFLAHAQTFSFPSGKLTKGDFISVKSGVVDSSGDLTLNSSTGDAQAFYSQPISLYNDANRSVLSFSTFFTFASNVTTGNGTVAFVVVPDAAEAGGLATARKTFTVEFNASCGVGGPGQFNGSGNGQWPGPFGGGAWGRGGPGGPGDYNGGGMGGFQVVEYANDTAISVLPQVGNGQTWDGTYANGPYFCSQAPTDLTNPIFQYQVVLEYNASTDSVWVGSPSCNGIAVTTQFSATDLSGIIDKPMYVGFIVSGGGVFSLSQWNFTSNPTSNSVTSLALSAGSATATDGNGGSGVGGGMGHSSRRGVVVAFAVLGAAIGIGAVVAVCCLCAVRRRRRVTTAPRFVAKSVHTGLIPEGAVVFDATKPYAAKVADRDTTPLNTLPNSASTRAPSWLQPVAPR